MRALKKIKPGKGFSLAELLIAVVVLGILLAIAVPNVLVYYRELQITELDDDARTIFLAAQNQLTALVNSGAKLDGIGEDLNETFRLGSADAHPELRYVEYRADSGSATPTGSTDLRKILPGGSVDTHFHKYNYVIEFDTDSGAVYGVWYWEKGEFDYSTNATATNQEKTKRVKDGLMVGFYGGD